MVERARREHPELNFILADVHALEPCGKFDFVILSDLLSELWDIQTVLGRVQEVCEPHTRIILNFYSRVWEPPLAVAQRWGFATPLLRGNWLTTSDVANLLNLGDFEVIRG